MSAFESGLASVIASGRGLSRRLERQLGIRVRDGPG